MIPNSRRIAVGDVLQPLGDPSHAVVKREYARRSWRAPAEVDQHDVAIVERRHHAVALDMHDAQIGRVGSQIVLYPQSLEMIRASVHRLLLDQVAAAHGGLDRDG